jgi:imidazolonepropionase-like amidohydrolase
MRRTSDFGSVEPQRVADPVLFDANPLDDIRNTARIAGVMLDGRYLDRTALDQLLERAEAAATKSRN